MRSVSTRCFTRDFSKVRRESLRVTDRGAVVGTWTPAMRKPQPIDFARRARQDFKAKLPFTFADLLREGKKR